MVKFPFDRRRLYIQRANNRVVLPSRVQILTRQGCPEFCQISSMEITDIKKISFSEDLRGLFVPFRSLLTFASQPCGDEPGKGGKKGQGQKVGLPFFYDGFPKYMKLLPPLFGGHWECFRDAVHILNRGASFLLVIVNLLSNPLMNCCR